MRDIGKCYKVEAKLALTKCVLNSVMTKFNIALSR
jgi:hypothetical protein